MDVPVPLVDVFAHERFLEFFHELGDSPAAQGAVRDGGLVFPETGEFPTFADMVQVGLDSFVAGDLFTAPHHGPQKGFEFQWIHSYLASNWASAKSYAPTEMALEAPILEIITPMRFCGS